MNNEINKNNSIGNKSIIIISVFIGIAIVGLILLGVNNTGGSKSNNKFTNNNSSSSSKVKINEQTILDDEYAKIILKKLSPAPGGYYLEYELTSKSPNVKTIYLVCRYVNSILLGRTFELNNNLNVNTKINEKIYISNDELKESKISEIGDFDIEISIYNTSGSLEKRKMVNVKTNKSGTAKQNLNYGNIIYSDEKMDVQFMEFVDMKEASKRKELHLLIYNKSSDKINLWTGNNSNIYLNGDEYYTTFNISIDPNKYGIAEISFFYDGNVEDIENAKVMLRYFDDKTYKELGSTEFFEFKTK